MRKVFGYEAITNVKRRIPQYFTLVLIWFFLAAHGCKSEAFPFAAYAISTSCPLCFLNLRVFGITLKGNYISSSSPSALEEYSPPLEYHFQFLQPISRLIPLQQR
jgi:hypothetical protein